MFLNVSLIKYYFNRIKSNKKFLISENMINRIKIYIIFAYIYAYVSENI